MPSGSKQLTGIWIAGSEAVSVKACSMGQCEVYLKLLQAVIAKCHILLQLGVVLLQLGVVLLCLLVQLSKACHLHSDI